MADQSGSKNALRPSVAPGSVIARMTRTPNNTTSNGMKILFARSMPPRTPMARTPSVMIQTARSGIRMLPTKDRSTVGVSEACRKSEKRNVSGSSPQALSNEKPVYMIDHAMMTA